MSLLQPYKISREKVFPISQEQLWDLISNTEHLNRMIGLPAVIYSEAESSEAGLFRWAEAKIAPFGLLRWQEFPFEWIKPKTYRVRRVFSNGPFHAAYGGIDLEPVAGGVLLRVTAEFTPRTWLGRLLVAQIARESRRRPAGLLRPGHPHRKSDRGGQTPDAIKIAINRLQLQRAEERLKELGTFLKWDLQRLLYILETSSDEEVLGLRPFALADKWNLNRRQLLRLFLYATKAGLLELEWQLMCPTCRVAKENYATFADVPPQFHCDFCGVDYNSDLDRSTELRFNVSPTIRQATREIYCLAGPVNSPHVFSQKFLAPGQLLSFAVTVPETAMEFRLRVLKRNISCRLWPSIDPDAASRLAFTYDGARWLGTTTQFLRGTLQLEVQNQADHPITLVFEDMTPNDQAVTADFVTSLPEFRGQFGSEVLAPRREMALRRICILFTDLKASTALYEEVGDASALGRVHLHFDLLTEIVQRNSGSVVKTMGDALMAVFYYADDGLRCALEIQSEIATFNQTRNFVPPLIVKVGLHQGPALAVTANNQIDYFGRTINISSRIQEQSQGGDILCSEEIFLEPGVQQVWQAFKITAEPLQIKLSGLTELIKLYRIRLTD